MNFYVVHIFTNPLELLLDLIVYRFSWIFTLTYYFKYVNPDLKFKKKKIKEKNGDNP